MTQSRASGNAAKLREPVSVLEPRFGVKADGVTDDSAHIQDAHDAMLSIDSNKQGELLFPPGRYKCLSGLSLDVTARINGYGAILDFSDASASIDALRLMSVSTGGQGDLTNGAFSGLQLLGPGKANANSTGIVAGSASGIAHEKMLRDVMISEFGKGFRQDSNAYNLKLMGGMLWRNKWNIYLPSGLTNNAEQIELHGVTLAEAVSASLFSAGNSLDVSVFGGSIDYNDTVGVDVQGDTIVSFFGTHFEDAAGHKLIDNTAATGSPTVSCFGCTFTGDGHATTPKVDATNIHFLASGGWIRIGSGTQGLFCKSTGVHDLLLENISIIGTLTSLADITGGSGSKRVVTGGVSGSALFSKAPTLSGGIIAPEVVADYFGLVFSGLGTNMGVYMRSAGGAPPGGEAGMEQGSLLLNRADKKVYINTGTSGSATWTVVGTQT